MDHLSDMAIFVAVAKAGSFIAAARALKMPSSTVSRRIALLEVRLGLRLLNDTVRDFGGEFEVRPHHGGGASPGRLP